MLPDEDGLSILKRLRTRADTQKIPVILVTAKSTEIDKVKGLDGGADDYIAKPFGVMEMIARVKALLRRSGGAEESLMTCGNVTLDSEKRMVYVDGKAIELTYKEFELLRLFLSHPGMAFTRDQLFNEIWGMDYCGETRTVDMHIRTLRQKLGSCGSMIQTVRNVGYRLEVGA